MTFNILSFTFFLICHYLYSQKEVDYQNLSLISEYNRGQHNAEKWAIIKYNFEPLDWDGKPTKYFNWREYSDWNVPKNKLYNFKFNKDDKVEVIRIREGSFGGRVGKWVQVDIEYGKLPFEFKTTGTIVPYEALNIIPYEYCTLSKADKPFKIGDTLMIEPIKNYRKSKVYPFYAIRNNKRLNLAHFYKINFELTDFKKIEISKEKRAYFESPKAWVEIKNEYFNIYFSKKKETINLVTKYSFFPAIILITLLIIYILLRTSNKKMNNQPITTIQKVNSSSLIFGSILFLGSFAFWFNQNSDVSLINIIIQKIQVFEINESIKFILHLFSTIFGFSLILNSGLIHQVSNQISLLPSIANYFYSNKPLALKIREWTKYTIYTLIVIILLFNFVMPYLRDGYINTFSFKVFIFLWLVSSIVKNINSHDVLSFPNFSGIKDFSEVNARVQLTNSQIAYIQSQMEQNDYTLYSEKRPVDVSLKHIYIFEIGKNDFSHTIDDDLLTKDDTGEIGYFFRISVKMINELELPSSLSSSHLKFIDIVLRNRDQVKNQIFHANDKIDIINKIKNNLKSSVNKLSTETIKDIKEKNSIHLTLESINDLALKNLENDVREKISVYFFKNSGLENLVKIEFNFKQSKYFDNEVLAQIQERVSKLDLEDEKDKEFRQKMFEKQYDAYIEERKIVLNLIGAGLTNPAIGKTERQNLLLMQEEVNKMNPMNGNFEDLDIFGSKLKSFKERVIEIENNPITQISIENKKQDLQSNVNEIADELRILIIKGSSIEKIKEELSNSTTYFEEYNINIYSFFEKLEGKISDFTTDKGKVYYRKIIGEIVNELS